MIEDFFDHKCNIYHVVKSSLNPGYGLPAGSDEKYDYGNEPDLSQIPCHFGVKSASISVIQHEPNNDLEEKTKLTLPAGTDIRINDKIVDCDTGLEYTAELPRNIREHHVFAYIKRTRCQKPL